jgi:hypothetical protein
MDKGNKEPNGFVISQDKITDLVKFQFNRKITNLSKNFLQSLEEIRDNSDLTSNNNFDYSKYRKRCLDDMNNCLRELDEIFNKLNINLK